MSKVILVAEDDVICRNFLVAILVREGYKVLEADSAQEVLRLSRSFEGVIDLLIADEFLKTMRAPAVFQRLRRHWPDLHLLQISVRLRAEIEKNEGLIHAEAEFLQKPFSADALTAKVKTMTLAVLVSHAAAALHQFTLPS